MEQWARLAWLYEHGEVTSRLERETSTDVTVRLLPADRERFERGGQLSETK